MKAKFKHEMIRASAGTGKTYQLTNRFLRLLQVGERPDQILATTFTRKAAGEILDRVLLRLAEAATNNQRLNELREALDDSSLTRDDCLAMLVTAARHLHRLRVGTLDSFFAQLAGSFSLELGLPPGWQIVEPHVDMSLRNQAVDAVLDGDSTADLLTLVHALTKGETSRSLDRVVRDTVNLLYSVYRESDAAAWSRLKRPTRLSDGQLEESIEKLRAVALPTDKRWSKARDDDASTAEIGDWTKFITGGLAGKIAAGDTSYYNKPIDAAVSDAYQPLIDHAQAVHLNQLADQTEATYRLLDKFHAHYQRLKSQFRALRFDDVTWQLAQSTERVRVGDVAFRLDAHIHHLLLDEFQDTSLAQWSVIRPFAQKITQAKSGRSFFCVGDVKQAIYGWRGGVAEIFDAVDSELKGVTSTPLDTSFRSSPVVIDTVNRVFTHLHEHENLGDLSEPVRQWQKQFNEHTTARTTYNGYACLQAARRPRDDKSDDQKEVTLRFAAEQVAEWQRKAPGFSIGVLVRRNDAVRRLIYHLRELNVEASEEGGNSLDDSAAVRVLLSLVQLADHPGDRLAAFHLATTPFKRSVLDNGRIENSALDDASVISDSTDQAAVGLLARQVRRDLIQCGYGPTIYAWARRLAPACNAREIRRLEKLIGLAYSFQPTATTRPRDFLAYVESQRVKDPMAADVRVMTVHQAKGLQFDIVVLADLESNLIGQRDQLVTGRPSRTSPIDRVLRRCNKEVKALLPAEWQSLFDEADQSDMAESLCVLYVAVTRAVHALHMIVAPSALNEKSLHKEFGGLLRAALTNGEPLDAEVVAFEHGDPRWYENPGVDRKSPVAVVRQQSESLEPLQIRLAAPAARRMRNLERVSPSGLEGGTHLKLSDVDSSGGADRAAALQRGTLIHAWFEQIEWLDDGLPSDDGLRQIANEVLQVAIDDVELDRMLAEFRRLVADRRIADCLSRNAYARFKSADLRVENERPIAVREGDRLLVGNIDRLVVVHDRSTGRPIAADILDYKTDTIDDGNDALLKQRVAYYRPQIEAYRRAVERLTQLPAANISARLLFTQPRRAVGIS